MFAGVHNEAKPIQCHWRIKGGCKGSVGECCRQCMGGGSVKTHEQVPKIKHVTSIRTLCDILNSSTILKNLFSEVHVLLGLY